MLLRGLNITTGICYSGLFNSFWAFLNGVLGLSFVSSTPCYDPLNGVLMGSYPDTSCNSNLCAKLKGAFGPIRITKGVARYTSTFATPIPALFPTF